MKKLKLSFGVLFLIFSCSDDFQPKPDKTNYRSSNNQLFQFFHTKKFRGFNIAPWTYDNELNEIVAKTDANIFRLSFTGGAKLMNKEPSSGVGATAEYSFNDIGFDALHRVLTWAKNHPKDIKILIDPHTAPGFSDDFTTSAQDEFWHNPLWRNHLIKLWDKIIDEVNIEEYQDVIAGYDLLNEPEIPDPEECQYVTNGIL